MAKKVKPEEIDQIVENISVENLEDIMGDRYATYAKYVIQDRAIPDVRDGLKPVQRRIIFSMYKSGNTINKPTKKCAHTVGAVMGTFHPHGDTSIYEALARMSQNWKVRYPLIDFQGNNGSIDGDEPAAYRYTEARLSEISNELIIDIDKKTVDMQLNFDDTEFEPVVLPSRFPNLLVNGTEGIAVALATEIPPHNLREVIEAVIYRISHKTATNEDLMELVKGPDFPGGGLIYQSEGLKNIYLTGRGRIEVASKTEIIENNDIKQIVITEIPYKIEKKALVFEIDKIIHSKTVSGLIEIRDESDWKGIRIVIDCKKDAKVELLLKYLMNKTPLLSSYSANMVAIVNGRPKTLSLIEFIDAYIDHQVNVLTRRISFDLDKCNARLHIVNGLIIASININEVVEIIKKSSDKADSKVNLIKKYDLSNEQAEAIVTMPLYKLSHTDEIALETEKKGLEKDIAKFTELLEDPAKLNRLLIKDLKEISNKYGDDRRTSIVEKEETKPIDKRELISKEEVVLSITRDGYLKRSTPKSFKGSSDYYPGLKAGDAFVGIGKSFTTNYLICFTNQGNYICLPVHKLTENKWRDEGIHINSLASLNSGEKIIKCVEISEFRNDVYLGVLTKFGQIKRMPLSCLETTKHSRSIRYIKLLNNDEVAGVCMLSGNSNILVMTASSKVSVFNENELSILGSNASGVKSISGLGKDSASSIISFEQDERCKILCFTNKGHWRIFDNSKFPVTPRLGKTTEVIPCFKSDLHLVVNAIKLDTKEEVSRNFIILNNNESVKFEINDYKSTDSAKYAKKNMDIPNKTFIEAAVSTHIDTIDKNFKSNPITIKEKKVEELPQEESVSIIDTSSIQDAKSEGIPEKYLKTSNEKEEQNTKDYEQISIFDDLDN